MEEDVYEVITPDNQCYKVPPTIEPQNLSASENQIPSRGKPQNASVFANSHEIKSRYKMSTCSWMCAILLVGFIIIGSGAFISFGIPLWSINSNLKTQTMGLQKTSEYERNIMELRNSVNNSISELKRRLAQLQVSVKNNALECERKITKLENSANDSISELNRRLMQFHSCSAIFAMYPSSPSGLYWIRSSNGSAVRVYCDMTRSCGNITGGWMRVASLNWSNKSFPCPDGFKERDNSGIHTCGINSTSTGSCPSLIFETYSTVYSRVCGKINAYQFGTPDAFSTMQGRGSNITIDSNYVDGVSLTHGNKPRRHIWTFAATHDDDSSNIQFSTTHCQCVKPNMSIMAPPSFVGMDYFCDTASRRSGSSLGLFLADDPLWDGAGCASTSTCCSFNKPPWFHKQLPSATIDDIEMRVCCDESGEDIAMSNVEIYVQ